MGKGIKNRGSQVHHVKRGDLLAKEHAKEMEVWQTRKSMKHDINIKTFEGIIPTNTNLVIYEKGGNPINGFVLEGFGEEGLFDHYFTHPQYCFINGDAWKEEHEKI